MTISRPNFRQLPALVASALVAAFAAQSAMADTLTFTGFTHGSAYVKLGTSSPYAAPTVSAAYVGAYNTQINQSAPTFESFCIDVWQRLSFNTNYSLPPTYTPMSSMVGYSPATNVPAITATVVGNLSQLYDYAVSTGGYGTNVKSAAMQLAIWELVYDPGSHDLSGGKFYSNSNSGDGQLAKNQATTWLAGLETYSDTKYLVSGFTSTTKQDVIVFTAAPITNNIPEPETYAMLLAGLGLVGGIVRRRRKEVLV